MSQRVLTISRDPGATNQMIAAHWLAFHPNAQHLCPTAYAHLFRNARPTAYSIYAEKYGLKTWESAGLSALNIENQKEGPTRLLQTHRISHVITGLDDIDCTITRSFWESARHLSLPVFCICDNDINIQSRLFTNTQKNFWPTLLFVRSHAVINELAPNVPDRCKIVLIPDLHHLRLKTNPIPKNETLRQCWQATNDETIILFASENASEMESKGRPAPFNEFRELEKLIKHLDQNMLPDGKNIQNPRLVIRPHPRDRVHKYARYKENHTFPIVISDDGTPSEAIIASDYIVGMQSAFLNEARLLEKPTFSLLEWS